VRVCARARQQARAKSKGLAGRLRGKANPSFAARGGGGSSGPHAQLEGARAGEQRIEGSGIECSVCFRCAVPPVVELPHGPHEGATQRGRHGGGSTGWGRRDGHGMAHKGPFDTSNKME
jgi:hypothetical protein